jgi:hypothetical protein
MKYLFFITFSLISIFANAKGVYQQSSDFIKIAFDGTPPKAKAVWITKSTRPQVEEILAHKFSGLRIRYWGAEKKTVWVLDEIGKDHPITVGIVINQHHITQIKVLEFRESRGDEVRHPFFTDQFSGISLTPDNHLNKSIDGISGATLSVRALTKIGRLALYLHSLTPFS